LEDLTLVAVVATALFFDFTNGFHDTANSIATSVSTRALSPRLAVLSAAILNVAGAFVSFEVAATVATGIVNPAAVTLDVVLAGLVGAITWNLITWYLGLPSSSSHALIGGMVGSAIAATGFDVVQWEGLVEKVAIPSLVAPLLGIVGAAALMVSLMWIVRRRSPGPVNRVFRRLQLISGGFVAFTHGTNDAQKTMGVIALALVASGHLGADFDRPPFWVIVSAALAMGLGTYAGGWRIIKTLGTRIAKLDPPRGFAAQTTTAGILWTTAHFGFPVSTTHTISGSVLGWGHAPAERGALGRGREHSGRVGHDHPGGGAGRSRDGGADALAGRRCARLRPGRSDRGRGLRRPLTADAPRGGRRSLTDGG
jgi:inorganic phosphate transporter, PiT family